MTAYRAECHEYEVYFEGETGLECVTVEATTAADMLRQLRETFPDDVGADGMFIDPVTGDERPLNW